MSNLEMLRHHSKVAAVDVSAEGIVVLLKDAFHLGDPNRRTIGPAPMSEVLRTLRYETVAAC